MCNKMVFSTKKDATTHAKIFFAGVKFKSKSHPREWKKLIPYYCVFCGNWHLTSQSRKESKRISRRLSDEPHDKKAQAEVDPRILG